VATVRDVITSSLVELGVFAAGETIAAADADLGLIALNRLMDSWAAERLQIFQVVRTTWTITSGTQTYAVGTGAVVNVARPVYIDHINFQDTTPSPDQEYQLEPLTEDAWASIGQKSITSTFPTNWYYTPTYTTGTIYLWPIPTSTTLQGVLYAPQAVAQFASLNTAVSLPPGYERMIVKNLAVEFAPSYERQVDQQLFRQALEAKETVKRVNRRLMDMSIDAGALGFGQSRRFWYDINIG